MERFYQQKSTSKFIYILSSILLITVLVMSGCSKKDNNNPVDPNNPGGGSNNNTNSITLNGGGFSNKVIKFQTTIGGFSPSDNMTGLVTNTTSTDTVMVGIYFPGNATGEFNWDVSTGGDIRCGISVEFLSGGTIHEFLYSKTGQGTIKITGYGNVGQAIAGSFSGTLHSDLSNKDVTISGTFSASRVY